MTKTKTATTAEEWKAVGDTNQIAQAMKQIAVHTQQVLDGQRIGMFVFGGSGLGKNHVVERELRARKLGHVHFITPANTNDLLAEFHKATYKRGKNPLPIVFDEARTIFETKPNFDVMKLATDDKEGAKRYHSGYVWFSMEHNGFNEETGEEKFKKIRHQGTSLKAPIIAMTNKNLNEFGKEARESAEALMSRVPPIHIPDDPLATYEYVVWLALTTDLLTCYRGQSLPLETRAAILSFFTEACFELKQISVRYLLNIQQAFVLADGAMLKRDLGNLIMPPDQIAARIKRNPLYDYPAPPQLDWAALRTGFTRAPKVKAKSAIKAPAPKRRTKANGRSPKLAEQLAAFEAQLDDMYPHIAAPKASVLNGD